MYRVCNENERYQLNSPIVLHSILLLAREMPLRRFGWFGDGNAQLEAGNSTLLPAGAYVVFMEL